jgi:pilus assembly protein CpaB
MKAARIVVLAVAIGAGGLAALLAGRQEPAPALPPPEPVAAINTTEVLVTVNDIGVGQSLSPQEMQWQIWPTASAGPSFIRKSDRPDALNQFTGWIVRTPFVAGEPIREAKLFKANGSGYMAAILPSGMRAVSTEISPETGAGGFILPNDRVDVLLTRRDRENERAAGVDTYISETVLTNVRVLAIDQAVEEKNGQKVVVGRTATLELAPRQAETLALSRQLGTLSLALRSVVDSNASAAGGDEKPEKKATASGINVTRFGVTTTATPR